MDNGHSHMKHITKFSVNGSLKSFELYELTIAFCNMNHVKINVIPVIIIFGSTTPSFVSIYNWNMKINVLNLRTILVHILISSQTDVAAIFSMLLWYQTQIQGKWSTKLRFSYKNHAHGRKQLNNSGKSVNCFRHRWIWMPQRSKSHQFETFHPNDFMIYQCIWNAKQ